MKLKAAFLVAAFFLPAVVMAAEPKDKVADLEKRVADLEKAVAAQPLRLGIVSEGEVLDNLEEKKDIDVDIDLRTKEAREILTKQKEEYDKLESEIGFYAEGSDERKQKTTELDQKKQELALKYRELNADVQQEAQRKLDELRMKIREHISRYAKEKGYDLVIERNALLYGEEGQNLTTNIIDQMNAEYFRVKYGDQEVEPAPQKDAKD